MAALLTPGCPASCSPHQQHRSQSSQRHPRWRRPSSLSSPFLHSLPLRAHANVSWRERHSRNRSSHVVAVGWDPENILAPPQPGHLARRRMQKQGVEEQQETQRREAEVQREQQRRREAREARAVPEGDGPLLDYLLRVEAEEGQQELQFEVARCHPRLTPSFFQALRSAAGGIRFAARQSPEDLERLGRLEALEKLLMEQLERQEALRQSIAGAKERLQALLSSRDKKEKILEMSASGELDLGLLTLLDQNIAAAQAAQQGSAVEFMEKVRAAVLKHMPMESLTPP